MVRSYRTYNSLKNGNFLSFFDVKIMKSFSSPTWRIERQEISHLIIQPKENTIQNLDVPEIGLLLQHSQHTKSLAEAKRVHAMVVKLGLTSNNVLANKLLITYSKVNTTMENARQLFDKIPDKNVYSWSAIISGYSRNELSNDAIELYGKMLRSGTVPDAYTYPSVLSACAKLAGLELGRSVHACILRSGFQNHNHIASALADMYFKCGRIDDARQVFDKISDPDTVTWNTMVVGYAENDMFPEAEKLFRKIPKRTLSSWNTMITGYARRGDIVKARELFDEMPHRDLISWNAMLCGYMQAGDVLEGRRLFDRMPDRDQMTWNHMISGYAKNGMVAEALEMFERMPKKDRISHNTMLACFVQNGCIDDAFRFFRNMPQPCLISWNTLVVGCSQNGEFGKGLEVFKMMLHSKVKPDGVTFASVLSAIANLVSSDGKPVHALVMKRCLLQGVSVGNALVDMYAKCGNLEDARLVFEEMMRRDLVSWNAIIGGYATHGLGNEALEMFEKMKEFEVRPDYITFLSVLTGCCHAGLVDSGRHHFESMNKVYGISPGLEHYCCMVDLLGRTGNVSEAYEFVTKMPVAPNSSIWASLLSACRRFSNFEIAEYATNGMLASNTENPGHDELVSTVYASEEG